MIQMCYLGPKEEGQEYLNAIASWDGEQCLLNEVHEKSFLHQQDSVAQILRGKGEADGTKLFRIVLRLLPLKANIREIFQLEDNGSSVPP